MNQTKSTLQSGVALGVGGALAILALFAVRVWLPDIYTEMGDMEKQAVTLLVSAVSARFYSLFGPKGAMPEEQA